MLAKDFRYYIHIDIDVDIDTYKKERETCKYGLNQHLRLPDILLPHCPFPNDKPKLIEPGLEFFEVPAAIT